MNTRNTPTRLVALAAAAALLLSAALPAAAQRRQRPPAQPPRAGSPPAAQPRPEARPATPRRAEPDRPFEELLPADGYGVYVELRRVGRLFDLGELKMAFAALRLFDADAAVLSDAAAFVNEHAELLSEARVSIASLPTRPGLPETVFALQLPSPEAAAGFEQKYRAFLTDGWKALAAPPPAPAPPRPARGRAAARQTVKPQRPAPAFVLKRAGSLLITAAKQFAPGRLRAEGAASFDENARFQSLRNRFASEQLFVYVDIERSQQGWAIIAQREREEREQRERARAARAAATTATATEDTAVNAGAVPPTPTGETRVTSEVAVVAPVVEPALTAAGAHEGQAGERGAPEEFVRETRPAEVQTADGGEGGEDGSEAEVGVVSPPPPPTQEEVATRRMDRLMRNLWGGVPRLPGMAALAVGLEGGTVALRVAVENTPDGPVNLIPFLPNVISGAPVTNEAAQFAPDDGEIFLSASLDWSRIFDALLGTARESVRQTSAGRAGDPGVLAEEAGLGEDADGKPATAEEALAEVEKFFGFKVKEDFLPTLGGEVAVSFPFEGFVGNLRLNSKAAAEEKDAAPGFVGLVALNDPDKARRLLPRALALFGLVPLGSQPEVESREGFEIRNTGGFAYAVVHNFLVVGQLPHVRHAVDSYATHRTLAATNGYRDATAWQARQKLVQAFVSDGLMRYTINETKKHASGSTDPVVLALLSQLEVAPEAASLASTNEGDIVLHELRLPLNLIKVFAAGTMIGMKEAPVIGHEMSAAYALSTIRSAQTSYRATEGSEQRYGTLEELVGADLLEKGYVERLEYQFEMNALGDRFEATATPKQYGKTGRRSFYVDESGIIRAADHKGKPASAQDPPID